MTTPVHLPEAIETEIRIYEFRGQKVLIDSDLAALYGVETRVLNQAVRRNLERFPEDFAFLLAPEEEARLISQIVISKKGGRRKPVLAFTEHGVAMLSSVLNSPRAVGVNIEIMRAFSRMRRLAANYGELARRIDELESRYDEQFQAVFDALRQLLAEPESPKKRMGFRVQERRRTYRP